MTTTTLVSTLFVPQLGRRGLQVHPERGLSTLWESGRSMNGMSGLARRVVVAVGMETGRNDIQFLTMLPWANVLDWKGLVRDRRAWCAACFEESRGRAVPVYEPLLWSLAPVGTCWRHGEALETRCPRAGCGRSQFFLAARSRPGYCSLCRGWLGANPSGEQARGNGEMQRRETWVGQVLGELLAAGPDLEIPPSTETIKESVITCARSLTKGKVGRLGLLCGLSKETIYRWTPGTRPGVDVLLRLSWHLGISPVDFLTRPGSVRPTATPMATRSPAGGAVAPPTRSRRDIAAIGRQLGAIVNEERDRPRSMRQVAKDLGLHAAFVCGIFPDLVREISSRYRIARREVSRQRLVRIQAEVKEAVGRVHARGLYPGVNRVRVHLSQPAILRHPAARAAWLEALAELGWEMGGRRAQHPPQDARTEML